jgi:Fe-Mn family superoxide dismutase
MTTTLILPELPYAMDALAPIMSAETLEYHHGKHHKAYADKGNELIAANNLGGHDIDAIMRASHQDPKLAGVFNNVAQFWNHGHFWQWMAPKGKGGGSKLPSAIERGVTAAFGGYDGFRKAFVDGGMGQFGSGWVWLVADQTGQFSIMKTPNGENPLVHGKKTLLGCDVWEHSYYIDYRNARQKYLEAFLDSLVNWEYVEHLAK